MLFVDSSSFDISKIINEYPEGSIEKQLLDKMAASNEKHQYENLKQLEFELNLRKEIVNSATSLNGSDFAFSNFKHSKCNLKYWERTRNGGFLLIKSVKPSEAVDDIFTNGGMYATECATAMMIVYYKSLLEIYKDELFNKIFPKIFLMGWDITEPLLEEVGILKPATDILLGDREYFNNPDFDRSTPEWEGENVIVLPDSLYYGHGIGIATADTIIRDLNSRRKNNSSQSSYLLNSTGRPNFKKLSDVYYNTPFRTAPLVWKPFPPPLPRA